jgi:hypothetical protein
MWATCVIKKLLKFKLSPDGRKFTKSGHPVSSQHKREPILRSRVTTNGLVKIYDTKSSLVSYENKKIISFDLKNALIVNPEVIGLVPGMKFCVGMKNYVGIMHICCLTWLDYLI